HAFVAAHEAVAGVGVELDVVVDAELREEALEPLALRSEDAIAAAVAPEHRADAAEILRRGRHFAVERRGHAERRPHGVEEGEPAAEAEADRPDARGIDF